MTLCDLHKRGFKLIYEKRRPVDERGIDGIIILARKDRGTSWQHGAKYWAAAHYAKQNIYGEPAPIPVMK